MKHMFLLFFTALSFYLTATSQVRTERIDQVQVNPPGISKERSTRIDKNIQEWIDNNWTNGSVAMIVKDGKIVYHKAFGYDDEAKKNPMKRDAIFRIASQTKAITSVAVMMLYENGKLMLEDPVSKFIPEFKNSVVLDKFNDRDSSYTTIPAKRQPTIRDLLTHTSGIGYSQIGSKEATAIYSKNKVTAGLGLPPGSVLADAIKRLGPLPLMHQPGEKWTYGLNNDVLGYIIEVVSGMSLDAFFRQHIFEPLGMKDTYFYLPPEKQSRLKTLTLEDNTGLHTMPEHYTYNGTMERDYPNSKGTYYSGGAGLSSTIYDYAIFLQMLLNGGEYNGKRILSRNTVNMMTTNQIGDLNVGNNKFGLGFSITTEKEAARLPPSAGTFAWGGIFSTTYWVDPKEKIIGQIYSQMWGRRHTDIDKRFMVLVYQALEN